MSRILTAKEICETGLRAIGAFAITDSAADGEHLREAMTWLDLIMGHTVGVERVFARVPDTVTLAIENGTGAYDLAAALGADMPPDGIQFPVSAWLQDGAGNRSPLEIVQRTTFEATSRPAAPGVPAWVYIDRLPNPKLRIYPVPAADDPTAWSVKLVVQQFAPNVAPSGITGAKPDASVLHAFSAAWQIWLVWALAHALGSGPIFKIGDSSLRNFEKQRDNALTRLLAFENREHDTEPPVTESWGA